MLYLDDTEHVPGKGSLVVRSIGFDGETTVAFGPSTRTECRRFLDEQRELRSSARNDDSTALRRAFG